MAYQSNSLADQRFCQSDFANLIFWRAHSFKIFLIGADKGHDGCIDTQDIAFA